MTSSRPQAPTAVLGSHPADDRPNRTRVAARLIEAYHAALRDEALSPLKREGDDMWTGLLRSELPELLAAIDHRDPEGLARYLQTFGTSYVWFGGITTCVDGYSPGLAPEQVALTYLDKLVCLAESLGVLRIENPASGPWGENLRVDPDRLVDGIAQVTGIDPSPPLGIIHTDGETHATGARLEVRVHPQSLRLIVPLTSRAQACVEDQAPSGFALQLP
jgi:hypothetical protein